MDYKKLLIVAVLLCFLVSTAGAAQTEKEVGNNKDSAKLEHQAKILELKEQKEIKHSELKSFEEKAKFKNEIKDVKDFNGKAEVYSDEDVSDLEVWKGNKNELKFKDHGSHKVRNLKIKYSDLEDVPGFYSGNVRITHYNDAGIPDVSWVQYVPNDGGYGYIDGVPFSEVVIGGGTGIWVVDDSEYLETTENINLGYSADPGMISFLNAYVNDFNVTGSVVGFEINSSDDNPAVRSVNIDGETLYNYNFSKNPIWGNIKRCTIDTDTLAVTYGTNNRGDGLDLTGASGPVMVEFPRYWVKYDNSTGNPIFWTTPYNLSDYGFEVHPAFMQGTGFESPYIYFGAFEGSLAVNDTGALYLDSKTGVQPWTGGELDSLAFTGGTTEFNIGDNLTGVTSGAYGEVIDYHVSSGDWGSNDAAGTVYLKQVNGTYQAENLQVSASTVAVSAGANSPISLKLDQSLGYANNINAQFTIGDVWAYSALQLLAYTEFGTRDLQSALGRGVVDLPLGVGYAGLDTGADSIYSNLDNWGTGVGGGLNGKTPTCWRGVENFASGGNVWEFIGGENMFLADGSVRLINPDGTGTVAGELTAGNYITLPGTVPLSDGYISGIQTDQYGALTFTPAATVVSSTTYYADYFSYPRANPSVVLFGGAWDYGAIAGVGCRYASYAPSYSFRSLGARLEFHPYRTENASSPEITTPNIQFTTNSNSTYSTGWDSSGDNPVAIPFSSSDEAVTTVYTSSDVLGLLDVNVTLGYLENTTIISEELTSEYYRLYITHIPGNDYESGFVNYTSDSNDILDSAFLTTELTSNNENAAYTLDTYDWSITTGAITAGTTYNYVLTAYLEGTVIDDTDRNGIGRTGLGAYEAEGDETTIIGSRFTAYSSKDGEWGANGSDIYVPASAIIGVVTLIILFGYAITGLTGITGNRRKD